MTSLSTSPQKIVEPFVPTTKFAQKFKYESFKQKS